MNNPDTGDKLMINTVDLHRRRLHLPARQHRRALPQHRHRAHPRPDHHRKTASTATATPGATVTYTITVTDTGQTPYAGARSPTT